jgi:hypothetical protein
VAGWGLGYEKTNVCMTKVTIPTERSGLYTICIFMTHVFDITKPAKKGTNSRTTGSVIQKRFQEARCPFVM